MPAIANRRRGECATMRGDRNDRGRDEQRRARDDCRAGGEPGEQMLNHSRRRTDSHSASIDPHRRRHVAHRLLGVGDEERIPRDHRRGKERRFAHRTIPVASRYTSHSVISPVTGATKNTALVPPMSVNSAITSDVPIGNVGAMPAPSGAGVHPSGDAIARRFAADNHSAIGAGSISRPSAIIGLHSRSRTNRRRRCWQEENGTTFRRCRRSRSASRCA